MSDLTSLKNIGAEMQRKLNSVEIFTAKELKEIGSKEAFARLKLSYPKVCLVHLYSLEGAISDTEYNHLSESTKQELKDFKENL
ncbi:MAG: TfoX/Sxy family protein [Coriobacteriia bacterium]|nr:TfoX/Sxy family protein [Coriobacteriia bacterium]